MYDVISAGVEYNTALPLVRENHLQIIILHSFLMCLLINMQTFIKKSVVAELGCY